MKLLFYGRLADVFGREMQMDVGDNCTIAELRRRLMAEHRNGEGALGDKRVRACVADTFVDDDYLATDGDVVEFLPPVSGG